MLKVITYRRTTPVDRQLLIDYENSIYHVCGDIIIASVLYVSNEIVIMSWWYR